MVLTVSAVLSSKLESAVPYVLMTVNVISAMKSEYEAFSLEVFLQLASVET